MLGAQVVLRMGRRWWHKSDQMCKGEVFVLQISTCELLLSIIRGGGKRALPLCLLVPGLNALRGVVQRAGVQWEGQSRVVEVSRFCFLQSRCFWKVASGGRLGPGRGSKDERRSERLRGRKHVPSSGGQQ